MAARPETPKPKPLPLLALISILHTAEPENRQILILASGMAQLAASPILSSILMAVREWGNILNGTRAVSFELSSLRLLRGVKSKVPGMTLLHLLAAMLRTSVSGSDKGVMEVLSTSSILVESLKHMAVHEGVRALQQCMGWKAVQGEWSSVNWVGVEALTAEAR